MGKKNINKNQNIPKKETNVQKQFDLFTFNWRVFALFLGLSFSYFIYYSHKLTDIESKLQSNIIEINAIQIPMPYGPLTGHKIYHYLDRKEALRNEFLSLMSNLDKKDITEKERGKIGSDLHRVINQISYFFPFARLLEFKEDGSFTFDPNNQNSIDISKGVDLSFLKTQADEIYNWNIQFTNKLIDKKEKVIEAFILEPETTDDKKETEAYTNRLIKYLENHYQLSMRLGLLIKEHDYFAKKINKLHVFLLFSLVGVCFLFGIALPLNKT